MRSVRYSTLPALDSSTALATSIVTVPTFGLGILPCGPRMRPRRPTTDIMSGVAIATSKSSKPSSMRLARSSAPTTSAPASSASRGLVALGEDGDLDVLAEAVGQRDRAAQLLVGVAHVQPGAHVHLDRLVELRALELLDERDGLGGLVLALAVDLARGPRGSCLPCAAHATTSTPIERAVPAMILAAWSTSCALRSGSLRSAISRSCAWRDRADLVAVGLARALVELDRLLDQHGGRRRLGDERERAVLVDRDHDRDDGARFLWVWALNALQNSMMLMPC